MYCINLDYIIIAVIIIICHKLNITQVCECVLKPLLPSNGCWAVSGSYANACAKYDIRGQGALSSCI